MAAEIQNSVKTAIRFRDFESQMWTTCSNSTTASLDPFLGPDQEDSYAAAILADCVQLPIPMSISITEFVLPLLVVGFLLAASFGIVPLSSQIRADSARRRLMLVAHRPGTTRTTTHRDVRATGR